jgi:6-phosphogluconolactonase
MTSTDQPSAAAGTQWVYVGTYTSGESRGIYLLHLDMASGRLTPAALVAEVTNPSFLAIHPNHRCLYAVNEVSDAGGGQSGAVSAFAIEPRTGKLTLLNHELSGGAGPCHLVVDHGGRNVLVANYGGGSVAVLPIQEDGHLRPASGFVQHHGSSVDPRRQVGPHAHSIRVDAADRYAFSADLGLDKVLIYRFDGTRGMLDPNDPPAADIAPGSGPRHFVFHPTGRWAYLINEMNSTATAFSYEPDRGALNTLQTLSTLPEGFQGRNSTAEMQVHPDGRFLYGSNRGHDSIALYAIDPATGWLTALGHQPTRGKNPRNFGMDATGAYLLAANQDSDNIVVFRIDPRTGGLKPTGHTAQAPKPVCVKMIPAPE